MEERPWQSEMAIGYWRVIMGSDCVVCGVGRIIEEGVEYRGIEEGVEQALSWILSLTMVSTHYWG